MQEYFVRETRTVKLDDGSSYVLVRGVRGVPDKVVSSPGSHKFGVIPLHEMTAGEREAYGLTPLDPVALGVEVSRERPEE